MVKLIRSKLKIGCISRFHPI